MKFLKEFYHYQEVYEKKLYIWSRLTRVVNLMDTGFYDIKDIEQWMLEYDFDKFAKCLIVSDDQIKNDYSFKFKLTTKDIQNSFYFNTESKEGYLIEDSKIEYNNQIGYLYVFKREQH